MTEWRSARLMRGAVAVLVVSGVGLGAVLIAWARPVRAAPQLAAVNGTVDGGADHVQVGTSAFPNFNNGALDNHYPLAHSHVDSSPFSEATASPADTGPLGQTAAAAASVNQPQYVDARCQTPSCPATATSVGVPGGPSGNASAQPNQADSHATAAGTTADSGAASPGAPSSANALGTCQAQMDRLWAALGAWRAEFLSAADAARYPPARRDASSPDGTDADTAVSQARFDPNAGIITVSGDARVGQASFGSGALVMHGIHTHVSVANGGKPKADIVTAVGDAEADGVPVVLDQNGISVNGAEVPGVASAIQAANAALNSAFAQGGLTASAVAPNVVTTDNEETVDAATAQVSVQQPQTVPGLPTQNLRHVLGEVFVDGLAVPGEPLGSIEPGVGGLSDTGGASGSPPTGGSAALPAGPENTGLATAPGGSGALATPGAPGSPGGSRASPPGKSAAFQRVAVTKPTWLLLLYFCWQSLVFGATASLWWWRKAPAS